MKILILIIAGVIIIAAIYLLWYKKPVKTIAAYECTPMQSVNDIKDMALSVSMSCSQQKEDMDRLHISINITNNSNSTIGYPLGFIESSGPTVRLFNPVTKSEYYVPKSPADFSLKDKYTEIKPQQSIKIGWVIYPDEIARTMGNQTEIHAEVMLKNTIQINGRIQDFGTTSAILIKQK
jgi:hypothetical protein